MRVPAGTSASAAGVKTPLRRNAQCRAQKGEMKGQVPLSAASRKDGWRVHPPNARLNGQGIMPQPQNRVPPGRNKREQTASRPRAPACRPVSVQTGRLKETTVKRLRDRTLKNQRRYTQCRQNAVQQRKRPGVDNREGTSTNMLAQQKKAQCHAVRCQVNWTANPQTVPTYALQC